MCLLNKKEAAKKNEGERKKKRIRSSADVTSMVNEGSAME